MNSQNYPVVSIMIATFNSGKILSRTLDSLVSQSYPREKMDIMIVDGGSTDNTLELAEKYGCRILINEKTEPVNAKLIGANNALGKYLVTLDHDEVLENERSIELKVRALQDNPNCKVALCSGYKRPKDYPGLNEYISEFGDPFSLFVYRFPKSDFFFGKKLRGKYKVNKDENEYFVVDFLSQKSSIIMELCCVATMIDLDYFKKIPNAFVDAGTMVHLFYHMLEEGTGSVIVLKNDAVVHYSADSLKAYYPKLKWRVCNNIHFTNMANSGFTGRTEHQTGVKIRKYFFIPYTLLIVPALFDSIYYSLSRKNAAYLLHIIFCWYLMFQICFQYLIKLLGIKPSLRSYDGKKKIEMKSEE